MTVGEINPPHSIDEVASRILMRELASNRSIILSFAEKAIEQEKSQRFSPWNSLLYDHCIVGRMNASTSQAEHTLIHTYIGRSDMYYSGTAYVGDLKRNVGMWTYRSTGLEVRGGLMLFSLSPKWVQEYYGVDPEAIRIVTEQFGGHVR